MPVTHVRLPWTQTGISNVSSELSDDDDDDIVLVFIEVVVDILMRCSSKINVETKIKSMYASFKLDQWEERSLECKVEWINNNNISMGIRFKAIQKKWMLFEPLREKKNGQWIHKYKSSEKINKSRSKIDSLNYSSWRIKRRWRNFSRYVCIHLNALFHCLICLFSIRDIETAALMQCRNHSFLFLILILIKSNQHALFV